MLNHYRFHSVSLADPNMGPRTAFLGRPRTNKNVLPFVCATPSTTKPGPLACARVIGDFTYEVSFVHLPGRGDLTCPLTCTLRASRCTSASCTQARALSQTRLRACRARSSPTTRTSSRCRSTRRLCSARGIASLTTPVLSCSCRAAA